MPLLQIWCSISPPNLEATSITLFTGLLNLSGNLSNYLGSAIIYITDVKYETLDRISIPLII